MSARITLPIEDALFERLKKAVPHGFRQHLMGALIELAVDAIERDGEMMTAALITKEYKLVPTREPAQ